MPLDEVVIGKVQSDRRLEVLALLGECQRQTGQTAHVQPRGCVQPLYVAGRNQIKFGMPGIDLLFGGTIPGVL